jgi:hypothetical protein
MRLFVIGLDSSGNTILNPSIYNSPVNLQLVYPYGGTADASLAVTYAASDTGAPTGTLTTSSDFGSLFVYSPSDVITLSLLPVVNGSSFGAVLGTIGSALYPTPAPSASPMLLPTPPPNVSYSEFYIYPPTGITFYKNAASAPSPITMESLLGTGTFTNAFQVYEGGFSSALTVQSSTCAGIATFTTATATSPYLSGTFTNVSVTATAASGAGGCAATFTDGSGNTATIPIYVTTTSVTGS